MFVCKVLHCLPVYPLFYLGNCKDKEVEMKLIKVAILTLFISQIAAAEIDVSLANGTEKEELKREQIFRLIEHYDLKKWWFTDKIIIDESARSPFSKLNKTGMFVSKYRALPS